MTFKKFNAFLRMNDREGRKWMATLEPDDLVALEEMMDLAQAAQNKAISGEKATSSPSTPAADVQATSAPYKPPLGLGKDGVYRMTDSQARNAAFCFRTQAARGEASSIELVPE